MSRKITEKNAISILKTSRPRKGSYERLQVAFDMAIEALEKQIPKKVEEFMEREEEFSSFYKLDFMCPSCCNATICQPYKPKYCKHCGQALDWS